MEKLKAKYGDLQNQIDTIKAAAEAKENGLDDADYTAIKALLDEQDIVKAQIATAERMAANEEGAESTSDNVPPTPGLEISQGPIFRSNGHMLQAIIAAGMTDRPGDKIGEFECGVLSDKLVKHQRASKETINAAASGANETTPSDGGFMVGTDFGQTLMTEAFENANIPSKCRNIPISASSNRTSLPALKETSRATGSRYGGVQVFMRHEAASVTATKMELREIVLELNSLMGITHLTDEIMQDASALEAWVLMMFGLEMGFKIDDLLVRGTGAGEPLGILTAPALRTIAKETGQTADTIVWENVQKLFTFGLGDNLEWYINKECLPELMNMVQPVGTGGNAVWLPSGGASGRPFDTLLGRRINYIEQASALGDKGDIMYADFSQYLFADKGGIQTASSIHVNFTTAETALRFMFRLDGQPLRAAPITPFKGATNATYSSFVTLAARA